jgi:hypothetical protein
VRWPWGQTPAEKRIVQFERVIRESIDAHWPAEYQLTGRQVGVPQWVDREAAKRASSFVEESIRDLSSKVSVAEASALAAEMCFHPELWRWRYIDDTRGKAADFILQAWVVKFPSSDIVARIQDRIERLLRNPCGLEDERFPHRGGVLSDDPEPYFHPGLSDCMDIVLRLPPSSQSLELARRLVAGDFDFPEVSATCWAPQERTPTRWYDILFGLRGLEPVPSGWAQQRPGHARAYEVRGHTLSLYLPALMELLARHGMFSESLFLAAARHVPRLLKEASRGFTPYGVSPNFGRTLDPAFVATYETIVDEVAWKLCQEFRDGDAGLLKTLEHLRGSRFLLRAATLHSENRLGHVPYQPPWSFVFDPSSMMARMTPTETLEALIIHLAGAKLEPLTQESRDGLVRNLKSFPKDTLEVLLPLAPHARDLLCEALEWKAVTPIVDEIIRAGRLQGDLPSWPSKRGSSPDPSFGVVDVLTVRAAIARAGEALTKRIVKLFRQSGLELSPTLMLIEATAGWNREGIEERIRKRNQPAVRAYGVLPILRGEDEVLERYLFFRQFAAESKKFGMMRQGNEKAAAKAGLENLARNAGYGDSTRLEWAMEARLGGSFSSGKTWMIGEHQVRLSIDAGEAEVVVLRDGQALRSVPQTLKRRPEFAEVKEALKQVRSQASRMKASLENAMAEGDLLGKGEVERLLEMPPAQRLVTSLVWATKDGRFGLVDGASKEFVTLDGSRSPLPDRMFLAHPYHLFQSGILGAWQREIVHRRIEQPFKQVFRELYVLTPAEEATRTFSNRFAGRLLRSAVAGRLLQVRGWKSDRDEAAVPYKVFPKHGLRATFDFPDAGHILAETETVTSDRIWFERHPGSSGNWQTGPDQIPLKEVPPLVFSEVMRDADLVVSVSSRGEESLSEEAFERRGEVVQALLEDLGLRGVTIDGHYAHVKGSLANYKVHLGTAHIFIVPGNYLCVVPVRWGTRHEQLFLPFADEGDRKFSEVVSKILFLIRDDRIKDESILGQIRQGGLRADPIR